MSQKRAAGEPALLVGTAFGRKATRGDDALSELTLLAESAGARVVASAFQVRERPDAATFVGSGKLEEIREVAEASGAELVLFDDELSPAQQRNIEKALDLKTLDRAQLILDIFAQRARTREGRLQVELAQLTYMLPRLAGKGLLLSRLGGGIGTRGPGETKLESDKRRIRTRIQSLEEEIDHVRRSRATRRQARGRHGAPVVALVGYTNAGKSTLFNTLTGQRSQAASARVFMTLDPLLRRAELDQGQEILLVDTVGFIQKLPHSLVAAFRATLEEVVEADLLLHVADAAAEDLAAREKAVRSVLAEIGAQDVPLLEVLNKADLVEPAGRSRLLAERPQAVWVSAVSGEGVRDLQRALADRLGLGLRRVRLRFALGDSRGQAGVYADGFVVATRTRGRYLEIEADLPASSLARYQEQRIS